MFRGHGEGSHKELSARILYDFTDFISSVPVMSQMRLFDLLTVNKDYTLLYVYVLELHRLKCNIKGVVHPKIYICRTFTHSGHSWCR